LQKVAAQSSRPHRHAALPASGEAAHAAIREKAASSGINEKYAQFAAKSNI
jgi:hypothetical protein